MFFSHIVRALFGVDFWGAQSSLVAISAITLAVTIVLEEFRIAYIHRRMRKREELFRIVTENAADMIALVDMEGRRIYNSPAYFTVLGYKPEELLGTVGVGQIHPNDIQKVKEAADFAKRTGIGRTLEYRVRHKNGAWITLESTASVIRDEKGHVDKLVIVNRDVTRRKLIEEKLEHTTLYDSLTDLPNRTLFMDRLNQTIEQVHRPNSHNFAVLLVDLDGFKGLNDTFGIETGNKLLVDVSRRFSHILRASDTMTRATAERSFPEELLARLGGDEFIILEKSVFSANDAMQVARRIEKALSAPFILENGKAIFVSASIGIAMGSPRARAEELVRDAHIAMMRARSQGRGLWQFYDPQMHNSVANRVQIELDLRNAIDRQQFKLYYQPIVDLKTGFIVGFEALIRWQRNDLDLVNPLIFIEIAEETGLILPIGQWVLKEACRQLRDWRNQYPNLSVTVNVSPKQFMDTGFTSAVETALIDAALPTHLLQLEITEGTAMSDSEHAEAVLERLKQLGVGLSIDDFGTGHSSLSRLRHFPLDVLKIDRSFVSGMESDNEKFEIIRLIVALAQTFSLKIIAEGTETAQQINELGKLGCQFGQGYFFSKPLDAESATELLEKHYSQIPFEMNKGNVNAFSACVHG